MLADKAYPSWTVEQRTEILRNHFVQGISSPSVQLRLMREMPATFDDALQVAVQLQSVETAQKRLYKDVHRGETTAMAVQLGEEQTTSYADATTTNTSANAVLRKDFDPTTAKLEEMTKELQRISKELAQLKTGRTTNVKSRQQQQRPEAGPICWNCNRHGHIQRDCPQPRRGGRGRSVRRRTLEYRSTTATNRSTMLVINGYIGNHRTHMLIDTGSDVSILREDIWKAICNDIGHLHDVPDTPVMVANGDELHVLGQTKIDLQVGGVRADFTCLVV